ncbi:MAG: hypothetical protein WD314_05670 [Trueperaceae bacterium]
MLKNSRLSWRSQCRKRPAPAPYRRALLILLLLSCAVGLAQPSVSVQIMTDSPTPEDFGSGYSLGQLSNNFYTYGTNFIIRVSYSDLSSNSLSLALSGFQPDYLLAWRVAGTSDDNDFESNLGADVSALSGSDSGYYRNDGTLREQSSEATRYRVGARSTMAASEDLLLQVTLSATLN